MSKFLNEDIHFLSTIELVRMDAKEMASEEVTKAREQINEEALNARRTDWDKEQMK